MNEYYAWATSDELRFIDGLAKQSEVGAVVGERKLLELYAAAMRKRTEWGYIDRLKVAGHVAKLLEQPK